WRGGAPMPYWFFQLRVKHCGYPGQFGLATFIGHRIEIFSALVN
ncbi:Unknown protein sequence, partial [Pseudomonas syringae pv. broussonetiae]